MEDVLDADATARRLAADVVGRTERGMSVLDTPVGDAHGPRPGSGRRPGLRRASRPPAPWSSCGLVIAAVVALAVATDQVALLIVVACLIVMIMLHELGHFLAAKHGHMKVTEYFLGFGPRLWSFRRGETEYGVKALPLGGYVKIPGMTNLEEVAPEDEDRTYRQQPFHARLLVAVAGSAMHFLMAFVLLWVLLAVRRAAERRQGRASASWWPSAAGRDRPRRPACGPATSFVSVGRHGRHGRPGHADLGHPAATRASR